MTDQDRAADLQPFRAEPGQRFGYTTATGDQREIVADSRGLVVGDDAESQAVLAGFGLPQGHVTEKDRQADSPVVRRLTAETPDTGKAEG
jgi:hypothetical protein